MFEYRCIDRRMKESYSSGCDINAHSKDYILIIKWNNDNNAKN